MDTEVIVGEVGRKGWREGGGRWNLHEVINRCNNWLTTAGVVLELALFLETRSAPMRIPHSIPAVRAKVN